MPELILWKNQEIGRFRKEMERLFDRFRDDFGAPPFLPGTAGPPSVDVFETQDELVIKVEIPGIDPDDLEISLTENHLTVKGEMRQEAFRDHGSFRRMERRYGSFSRTIRLPCRVLIDDVTAHYEKGVLKIAAPKCKPNAARAVKVKVM